MAQKPFRHWRRFPDPSDPHVGVPYTLVKFGPRGALRVVYCGGAAGNFLLSGLGEALAIDVVDALEGYLALDSGWIRADSDLPPLYALARVPNHTWDDRRVLIELQAIDPDLGMVQINQLRSGTVLDDRQQHYLQQYLPRIIEKPDVRESMKYFRESRRTVNGHMSASYYQFHYRHDRRAMNARQLQRKYRHYRAQYETAFVSAFKALERLLGTNQIHKQQIQPLLDALDHDAVRSSAQYERLHETFRELPRTTTYGEMVAHFLLIRNVVAAHANRSPPTKFSISEDSIYEIQFLLSRMYYAILGPVDEYKPPSYTRGRRRGGV